MPGSEWGLKVSAKNLFVDVRIDQERCIGIAKCGKCVSMCPVRIFKADGDNPLPVEDTADECTLCDICTNECPEDAITVKKLY
jgi:NAD-dependent dihydropyrimidine dehydrogenase PreA subunit